MTPINQPRNLVEVPIGILASDLELSRLLASALADEGSPAAAAEAYAIIEATALANGWSPLEEFLGVANKRKSLWALADADTQHQTPPGMDGWISLAGLFSTRAEQAARKIGSALRSSIQNRENPHDDKEAKELERLLSRTAAPLRQTLAKLCDKEDIAMLFCRWAFDEAQNGFDQKPLSLPSCIEAMDGCLLCPKEAGAILAKSRICQLPDGDANLKILLLAMAAKLPTEGCEEFLGAIPRRLLTSIRTLVCGSQTLLWDFNNPFMNAEITPLSFALLHGNYQTARYLFEKAGCDPFDGLQRAICWAAEFNSGAEEDLREKQATWTALVESWTILDGQPTEQPKAHTPGSLRI